MEEFGDWIYIIVIIVAGIVSLIGSARKKAHQAVGQNQQNRQPSPEINTNPDDGDDFWGTLTQQTVTEPERKAKPVQKAKPPRITDGDYHTIFDTPEMQVTDMDEGNVALTVNDLPDNADEWRKAFVYNEIFNRKN